MTIILYHEPRSPACRLVVLAAKNLGVEVEIKLVSLVAKDQLKEEFLKLNPLHKVPVLQDGNYVLTESRAIATYLANSKGSESTLYPSDPKARGLVDSKLYYDATIVFPRNSAVVHALIYHGKTVITQEQKEPIIEYMNTLDSFLDGQKWFAGPNVTLADLAVMTNVTLMVNLNYDLKKHKNLSAWFERCKKEVQGSEEINEAGVKVLTGFMKSLLKEPIW